MKSSLSAILLAVLVTACAGVQLMLPTAATASARRYNESLLSAAKSSRSGKWQLRECIKNWGSEREGLLTSISEATSKSGLSVLILELGGTGFGRHEYLLVTGGIMTTGQGTREIVPSLGERIKSFAMLPEQTEWQSGAFDANCYFLTISKNGMFRTQATYDLDLSSESGKLIGDLLDSVH